MDSEQISKLLGEFDDRLSVIERTLGISKSIVRPPEPPQPEPASPLPPIQGHSAITAPLPQREGSLLGAAGILFFILATAFFIGLAIESGWLTPVRQLAGVGCFGAALIGAGYRLRESDARYASYLPGGGLVVLFMAGYAGHLYYGLYNQDSATILLALTTFLGLSLFRVFKQDFFLVVSIVGTYGVPMLIGVRGVGYLSGILYFTAWDVLFCACAILLGRRQLIVLTAYLALAAYMVQAGMAQVGNSIQLAFQTFQFLLLGSAVLAYSIIRGRALSSVEAWSLFPVLLLFYGLQYAMLGALYPARAPVGGLLSAAVVVGAYHVVRFGLGRATLASAPMVATFTAIALLHVLYLELLPKGFGAWFAFAAAALLAVLSKGPLPYARFWPVYFLIFGVVALEYVQSAFNFDALSTQVVVLQNTGFAILVVGAYLRERNWNGLLLALGLAQALIACARFSSVLAGPVVEPYLTSGLWALLALGLLLFGRMLDDGLLTKSSSWIFATVAVKVLVLDLAQSNSIVRVGALVVIGAVLYLAGMVTRKRRSDSFPGEH